MKHVPLNLADLSPIEAAFELSGRKAPLTLCRWSLRVRAWAVAKYTSEGLDQIFRKQDISAIADMAYFMLKEKDQFKSQDDFLDAICSIQDQINLIKALLQSVGIGEPEMQKIAASLPKPSEPEAPVKKKRAKTGAKSSTL